MLAVEKKRAGERIKRIFCLILALALLLAADFECMPASGAQAASDGMIRVKLTRLGSPSSIRFTTNCGYIASGSVPLNLPSGSTVTVTASGGVIFVACGGMTYQAGSSIRLMRTSAGNCGVRFSSPSLSNVFCGDLYFGASGSTITTVLNIYIEDYLYGVVAYEMSNSYPLEALKAQAVAARNYALKKKASRGSLSYDVTDNTNDQVFKGYNSGYTRIVQAVNETRGMCLYYGNSLASCYYAASNGGQTESTKNAWGGSLGYSVVKDDPYDLENTGSTKRSASISKNGSGLNASLKAALISGMASSLAAYGASTAASDITIEAITEILPTDPRYASPSRLYKNLRFTLRVSSKYVSTGTPVTGTVKVNVATYGNFESWYGLSINSGSNETISVDENSSAFIVTFRRYGHGIGMSQRGAQTMANIYSKTYSEILGFYYPGTSLTKLSLSDSSGSGSGSLNYPVIATAEPLGTIKIYESADIASNVRASVSFGLALDIYQVKGKWAAVGISGCYGYVETAGLINFTLKNESFTDVAGDVERYLTAQSNLLELPVEGAFALNVLETGAKLKVQKYSANWAYVETEGLQRGYLPVTLLAEAAPSQSPSVSPSVPPSISPSVSPSVSEDPSVSPDPSPSVSPIASASPSVSPTPTPSPSPTPSVSPSPSPTQDDLNGMIVPGSAMYAYVNVSSGSLKLRAAASTSSATIQYLKRKSYLQVLAYNSSWAYVRTASNARGYAAIRYLKRVAAVPTPTPSNTPSTIEGGRVIRIKGVKYGYVAARSLNFYQSYSSNSRVIRALDYGTRVRVYAYNSAWCYAKYGNVKGYLPMNGMSAKKITAPTQSGGVDTGITFCSLTAKTRCSAKMYQKNSTASARIKTLASGVRVKVTAYNRDWAYVSYGSKRGFVQIKYLRVVS